MHSEKPARIQPGKKSLNNLFKQFGCLILFSTMILFSFQSRLMARGADPLEKTGSPHHLGIAVGGVYLSDDQEFAPGIALDYGYDFTLGGRELFAHAAIEYIIMEKRHIGFNLGLGFSPFGGWSLSAGPGMMREGDISYFCINLGSSYEWEIGRMSFGPKVELAHTGKHFHLMSGFGVGFSL